MDVSKKDIKTFRVLLSGRVQGVGFRYFVHDMATRFSVNGYVQNTRDNKVEIICQGQENNLDMFILAVKKGPALSFVSEFLMEEIKDFSFYDIFDIKH
jgi:acylphosphatase